jgi:hypothetical protein
LSKKRKKWVEANRENGFDEGIKRLLTDLYPDNAHFIYELLQNAEDALATEVRFVLKDDRLEFEHNGNRLFSIEDVDSITSIGVSTKKDEPTSIGKFGVGFKAVFAYTSTPEISSGNYHFCIRDLVIPDTEGLSPCILGDNKTRMVFPFDNPKKPLEKARSEIEKKLRHLNESTLLFLSNINKIEYTFPNSTLGVHKRTETTGNRIEISVHHPESLTPVTNYFIRFNKDVEVNDENGNPKLCRISIAFGIEKIEDQGLEKSGKQSGYYVSVLWRIKPLNPGQVFIYFPTEKETSNLYFHIHAPFASTVARDSVRDCASNKELRDQLARLLSESMTTIRDMGLLTVKFLTILPNNKDNLSSFYAVIKNLLRQEFIDNDLTPMKLGGHAAADGIFRGYGQITNLISDEDLVTILGHENYSLPMWVANPQQRNQREDNFLSMLNISEWTIDDLVNSLSSQPELIMKWIAEKTDEWHIQLYALLGDYLSGGSSTNYYEKQKRKEKLSEFRIVRLSDGSYSIGRNCYFPNENIGRIDMAPFVAQGVYVSGKSEDQKKKAEDFLRLIGVREFGINELVETILKNKYVITPDSQNNFKPDIKDISLLMLMIEINPSLSDLCKDYFIFKQDNGDWVKPCDIYLDTPFLKTGLSIYFEVQGNKTQYKRLSQDYKECGEDIEKIGEFAKKVGAMYRLPIKEVRCENNPEWNYLFNISGRYGNYKNEDFTIEGLDELLKSPSFEQSLLVFNTMNSLDEKYLKARYKKSDKSGYRYADSQLIHLVKKAEWIPQENGKFVRPCDAFRDKIPLDFPNDWTKTWCEAVGFGTAIKTLSQQIEIQNGVAQRMGFISSNEAQKMVKIANLLRQQGKSPDELIYQMVPQKKGNQPEFPRRRVRDTERRQDRLGEQLSDAPDKKYEIRERRVRTTNGAIDPITWLRNQYTNETDQMVCQICKEEMPFRKRDGAHYFEKKEVLTRKYLPKEHEAQYLALCPLCAAKYEEFVKTDDDVMTELKEAIVSTEDCEVPITLGDQKTCIRFVETHHHDLKVIIDESV